MFCSRVLAFLITFFDIVVSHNYNSSQNSRDKIVSDGLKNIFRNYDKHVRPNYTGPPTDVYIMMNILTFTPINERKMNFGLDIFLFQRWHDYRLSHNLTERLTPMLGLKSPADYIWVPDTLMINALYSKLHYTTVNNNKLDIFKNGTVHWTSRITVKASCRLNLRYYPLDTQYCSAIIESYAYTIKHIRYHWYRSGIFIKRIELAQHTIEKVATQSIIEKYSSGDYALLKVYFIFKRRRAVSIIQIFFPTNCIVCVSFIGLWINKYSTSARIGMGVTTLLTLVTLWKSVNYSLPLVSYIKVLDVYFMTCFCLIFLTLVEYTIVLNLDSSRKRKLHDGDMKEELQTSIRLSSHNPFVNYGNSKIQDRRASHLSQMSTNQRTSQLSQMSTNRRVGQLSQTITNHSVSELNQINIKHSEKKRSKKVKIEDYETGISRFDIIARVLFPLCCLAFNLLFWHIFVTNADEYPNGTSDDIDIKFKD